MGTVGFIGCGNMGSAIAAAVAQTVEPSDILLADALFAKAEDLAASLGARAAANDEVARESRFLFLAVKPQVMAQMLSSIRGILRARTDRFVLVTIAAGLEIADIARMADGDYPIIRIMPNTPVAVCRGMTVACASPEVREEELDEFRRFMSASGRLDFIPEDLIDAAGALSGCGPAFVYLFLDALADGAAACGLPREKALAYACQTMVGAATMVTESGREPAALTKDVCSPGGTTIEGVHALEEGDLRGVVMSAVQAAFDKTAQLKQS